MGSQMNMDGNLAVNMDFSKDHVAVQQTSISSGDLYDDPLGHFTKSANPILPNRRYSDGLLITWLKSEEEGKNHYQVAYKAHMAYPELDTDPSTLVHIVDLISGSSMENLFSIAQLGGASALIVTPSIASGLLTDEIRSKLAAYADLKPDWDGYGAAPISNIAIAKTEELVSELPCEIGNPKVVPVNDGSINIAWEHNNFYLEMGFDPQGRFSFYAESPELGEHELPPCEAKHPLDHPMLSLYLDSLQGKAFGA